ncbi:hypothetical protein TRVL_00119 [Trypanosoma vivax]|nr:hypothetical protein TRVL_00119 [Trypanosoma vivax]
MLERQGWRCQEQCKGNSKEEKAEMISSFSYSITKEEAMIVLTSISAKCSRVRVASAKGADLQRAKWCTRGGFRHRVRGLLVVKWSRKARQRARALKTEC